MAELGIDGGDDHVDVGDASVRDEDLGAVEHPLVAVELRRRAKALDVGARLRLGHRVGAELDLVPRAQALGDPSGDLLGGARRGEACRRQGRSRDRQRDPRAAPVELLRVDHRELAIGIVAQPLEVVDAVQAPLPGGLDYLPRRRFLGVVLRCHRTDHLGPEAATQGLELPLLLAQPEIHRILRLA